MATTPESSKKAPRAKIDMQGFTTVNRFGDAPDARARGNRSPKETPFGG